MIQNLPPSISPAKSQEKLTLATSTFRVKGILFWRIQRQPVLLVKVAQSCLTLCNPMDYKVKVKVKSLSRVWLFATRRSVAHQAPPSMGFSTWEYWSGLPFPSPGDLPDPGKIYSAWKIYSPWNSPGQNTGVVSLSILQGIFPAQGLNPGLPHCGWILYQMSHKGSSRILEWVAYPFSRGSSPPRNRTGVSCIAQILYQLSYQGNPIRYMLSDIFLQSTGCLFILLSCA